jgi:hypothetical protein
VRETAGARWSAVGVTNMWARLATVTNLGTTALGLWTHVTERERERRGKGEMDRNRTVIAMASPVGPTRQREEGGEGERRLNGGGHSDTGTGIEARSCRSSLLRRRPQASR